jgi:proteasome lid subunit RPN8/RPN11
VILVLPDPLRARVVAEARAAFPNECCGLLEGRREGETVHVTALHPAANLAESPATGFEIDPAVHFRLLRALRRTDREIVGCYHSHPNGRAEASATDRARNANAEVAFVWLIAAVSEEDVSLAAFAGPEFRPVRNA